MTSNIDSKQPLDTSSTANRLVAQLDSKLNSLNQQIVSASRFLYAQNQTLQAHNQALHEQDQSLQVQNQHQAAENQRITERLDLLISIQNQTSEMYVALNTKMQIANAYQQRTLNIIDGIARLLFWPFRRSSELPGNSHDLVIAPAQVVIEEVSSPDVDHPVPKPEVTKTIKIIRFALWGSTPIRWVFGFVISILCHLAQKIGLIRRNPPGVV